MMHTFRQTFLHQCSASGASFRRVARVNLYALSTSVRSFVVRELYELIPRRILNAFRKTVIFNHAKDIQVLKGDDSEHRNERVAELMREIAATISDAFMDASCRLALLFTLSLSQRFLIRPKEAWISNLLTCGQRGECRQANVNSDASLACRKWTRFDFHREASEPFACDRACDSQRLNLAFNRPVQLDSHVSDFRQSQLAIAERKAGLSIGERIVSPVRTKAWEACLIFSFHATKESVKRFFNSLQNVLQDLAVDIRNIITNLLDVGELVRLPGVAHGLSFKPVCVSPLLQARVIEFTAKRKCAVQSRSLRARREDAILEGFEYYLFSHVCHVSIVSGLVRAGILLIAVFRLACIVALRSLRRTVKSLCAVAVDSSPA